VDSLLNSIERLAGAIQRLQQAFDLKHIVDGLKAEVGRLLADAVPSLITRTVDVRGHGGPFVDDATIRLFEPRVQALADAALVLVAMWAFYRVMWGHGMFSQYTARIMLPRLAVAAALINLAPQLFQAAVDLENALSASVLNTYGELAFREGVTRWVNDDVLFPGLGPLIALCLLAGFLVLAFAYVIRYALLVLLAILAPGAALLMVLPDTNHYAREWMSLFVTTLLMQPVQLLILAVGLQLELTGDTLWRHGFALASLWLCYKVPGALHSASTIGTHASSMAKQRIMHLIHAAARL
jgi:hypothetical protein